MMSNKEFDAAIRKCAVKNQKDEIGRLCRQRIEELVQKYVPQGVSSVQLHLYAVAFRILADAVYNQLPKDLQEATDLAVKTSEYTVVDIKIPYKESEAPDGV